MILALWLPALASLLLTTGLEALLKPRPAPLWRRAGTTQLVHVGTWGIQFAFWLLLVQRPWFALVIMGSLQMVVIQVSNTKAVSLREPFLCQDFEYFVDAIRHPRLYIPFFGIGLTIAASLAGLAAIIAGFMLEPSLMGRFGVLSVLLVAALLASLSLLALWAGLKRLPACSLDPNDDLTRLGLFAYLWAYGLLARRPLDTSAVPDAFRQRIDLPQDAQARLPNVVAVQSESFFDPRHWCANIEPAVLAAYDRLAAQAPYRGRLQVPAWGANTVRTECAFLTGLTPEVLGIHRFNPYHQLTKQPVANLAGYLRELGYRTVCIHPYPASFYLRDKVFPRLGFETFIDIRSFAPQDRDGQYTGDLAVAEKVKSTLSQTDSRPLFVFVITMENHGPLHLEQADPDTARRWYRQPPASDQDELTVYLRHLHNADRMIDSLAGSLAAAERPGLLCWYGDHVPIMPGVYAQLGEPDGLTNYLLWSTHPIDTGNDIDTTLTADTLGALLLDSLSASAGLTARAPHDAANQPATHEETP